MADILFVCVRKDIERADALARMFQAAGFSIGDMPSTDGRLRSTGAGLVLWSAGAMQSLPFHDAARRLVKAGRAVLADLGGAPLPPSLSSPPAFALSEWNGDPDDALIDPLFSAVDRMVSDVRAQIERWQAICESRDPSVFADYVALYGANGVYAEEAELRLKLLSAGQSRTQRVAASAGAVAYAAPAMAESWLGAEPAPRPAPPPASSPQASPPPQTAATQSRPRQDRRRPHARKRRRPGSLQRALMLAPLVVGAALAAMVYVGGVEESKDPAYRVRIPLPPVEVADAARLNPPAPPAPAEAVALASPSSGLPASEPDAERPGGDATALPPGRAKAGGAPMIARAVKAAPASAPPPFAPASRLLNAPIRMAEPLVIAPVSTPTLAYDFAPTPLAQWPGGARRMREQSSGAGASALGVEIDVAPARRDRPQGPQP